MHEEDIWGRVLTPPTPEVSVEPLLFLLERWRGVSRFCTPPSVYTVFACNTGYGQSVCSRSGVYSSNFQNDLLEIFTLSSSIDAYRSGETVGAWSPRNPEERQVLLALQHPGKAYFTGVVCGYPRHLEGYRRNCNAYLWISHVFMYNCGPPHCYRTTNDGPRWYLTSVWL